MSVLDTLAVPADIVVTDPDTMQGYRRDMADLVPAGKPAAVLRPTSTVQVSAIMTWAHKTGMTVVPRGAGTGLSGGATAIDGCVIVSLERMRAIRSSTSPTRPRRRSRGDQRRRRPAVAEHGLFYLPDPGSSKSPPSAAISRPTRAGCGASSTA